MSKSNDVTGDRITNALKGNKEAYREGWEAIFNKKKPEEEDVESVLDELTKLIEEEGFYDE